MSHSDAAPHTSIRAWPARLSRRLGRALATASAGLLALLVALAAVETGAWLLAERSWPQLAEIQGLLLVWLTFLTAAWGVQAGLHLGMELLVARLPAGPRRAAEGLAGLLVAGFGLLCAAYGARLAGSVVNTLPATGWSAAWQYIPAVVGGAMIALLSLLRLAGGPAAAGGDAP